MARAQQPDGTAVRAVSLSPWWAGWRLSVVLLAAVVSIGTAGFVVIEGWDPFDAFYMTITTVTTVGYGDHFPITTEGRLVAVALMIVGIAMVGAVTASVAAWMIGQVERERSREVAKTPDRE